MAILKAQKGIPTRNVDPYPEEKIREDRTDAKLKEWDTIQNSPGGWWKGRSIPTTKDPALRRELARRQAGYDVKPVKEKAKDLAVNAAWSFIPELPIVKNAIGTAAGKVAERFITKNPLKDDIASGLLRKSPKFKSEIDWGAWNKEIPANQDLLKEYNNIEKSSKAKGTWMKNPDGSAFKGTPEQFVQQNSSNFKKSFTNPIRDADGNIQTNYHGSSNKLEGDFFDPSRSKGVMSGSGIYTTYEKELAAKYAAGHPDGRLYELYINSNKPQNVVTNADFIKYKRNADNLKLKYKNAKTPAERDAIYDEIKSADAEWGAKYKKQLEQTDLTPEHDFFQNDVNQVIPYSNYPKSMVGNNGMFDMTNPNIYKSVVPLAIATTGAGLLKRK